MPLRYGVIRKALVTERSSALKEKFNQAVFKTDPSATKKEIKEAVEEMFHVDVEKVRTINVFGKLRRYSQGKPQGRRPDWKKAILTLKKGQEIKIEEETSK